MTLSNNIDKERCSENKDYMGLSIVIALRQNIISSKYYL